jgi:hypothetical protein
MTIHLQTCSGPGESITVTDACGLEYDVKITSSGQRVTADLAITQAARGTWDIPSAWGTTKGTYSVKVSDNILAAGTPVSVMPYVLIIYAINHLEGTPQRYFVAQGTVYRAMKRLSVRCLEQGFRSNTRSANQAIGARHFYVQNDAWTLISQLRFLSRR